MTVIREYTNFAPLRYQRPVELLTRIFAIPVVIAVAAHYLFGMARPWLECGESLFFMAWGINWFLWPNGPVSNPLATRLLGGLLFVGSFGMLIDFILHHLI